MFNLSWGHQVGCKYEDSRIGNITKAHFWHACYKSKESCKDLGVLTCKLHCVEQHLEIFISLLEDKKGTTILGEDVFQNVKLEN